MSHKPRHEKLSPMLTRRAKKHLSAGRTGFKTVHKASWYVVSCPKHGTPNRNGVLELRVSAPKVNTNIKHLGCPICRANSTSEAK